MSIFVILKDLENIGNIYGLIAFLYILFSGISYLNTEKQGNKISTQIEAIAPLQSTRHP